MIALGKYTLGEMNTFWNRFIKPVDDPAGTDYWQTPLETITKRTGDCDDYSVIKFFTLLAYGADPDDVQLYAVKLKDILDDGPNPKLINHVFVVYKDWVLDNISTEIVKITDRLDVVKLDGIITLNRNAHISQFKSMLDRMDREKEMELIKAILDFYAKK